jgi:photosystem II stability/assembly factor-like uncharacterized protein
VIRTIDAGKTWNVMTVPGAEKLDFRDIEAFDGNTAYILSIGNGDASRIYKTADGGKSWKVQFKNTNAKAFFDAMACWDARNCIAMSDPVDERFVLIETRDGGATWKPINTRAMPPTRDGEAAFAASGTCLITQGKNTVFLVSGGNDGRVFRSTDRGAHWKVADTPILKGTPGSGIFSIAMLDAMNGIIVGGDYEKPAEGDNTFASTIDGGKTWLLGQRLGGFRSSVSYIDRSLIFAAGTNGSDFSKDGGRSWHGIDAENYNAVRARGIGSVWAVGPRGRVAKFAKISPGTLQLTFP